MKTIFGKRRKHVYPSWLPASQPASLPHFRFKLSYKNLKTYDWEIKLGGFSWGQYRTAKAENTVCIYNCLITWDSLGKFRYKLSGSRSPYGRIGKSALFLDDRMKRKSETTTFCNGQWCTKCSTIVKRRYNNSNNRKKSYLQSNVI